MCHQLIRRTVGNCRPIPLLSTLAKVQERIVFCGLYKFLSENILLTTTNSWFKERDSTIYQLINIVDKIYKALEGGKDVNMVFLDISKAFDKGLHHQLRANGICGNLLTWLEDYLTNRKIRVVINGQAAQWALTNAGVPEGSILGPLLFLIFINDIGDNIESDINLFSDETSLMKIIELYEMVDRDLQVLADLANQWLVTFNAAKTIPTYHQKERKYCSSSPLPKWY